VSEKTACDGNEVIVLLEDESAGDEVSSPLVVFRTAFAAISGNVFLGNAYTTAPILDHTQAWR
jgi:hypothetical protein